MLSPLFEENKILRIRSYFSLYKCEGIDRYFSLCVIISVSTALLYTGK